MYVVCLGSEKHKNFFSKGVSMTAQVQKCSSFWNVSCICSIHCNGHFYSVSNIFHMSLIVCVYVVGLCHLSGPGAIFRFSTQLFINNLVSCRYLLH